MPIIVRPSQHNCFPEDLDLLHDECDDLDELRSRCLKVREQMNDCLPPHDHALDDQLVVKISSIPYAGKGLFNETGRTIKAGSTVCYYTGHRHNFKSQQSLQDKSYLLNVAAEIFVDPGPILAIKARYINDPLNEKIINCTFVPQPEHFRCAVVAKRDISPGEELFVSYGDQYWSQQKVPGKVYSP